MFRAVTRTTSRRPTSSRSSLNVLPIAPPIAGQLIRLASQRNHCSVMVIGWVPSQRPGSAVRVAPSTVEPPIVGATTLRGAAGRHEHAKPVPDILSLEQERLVRGTSHVSAAPTRLVAAAPLEADADRLLAAPVSRLSRERLSLLGPAGDARRDYHARCPRSRRDLERGVGENSRPQETAPPEHEHAEGVTHVIGPEPIGPGSRARELARAAAGSTNAPLVGEADRPGSPPGAGRDA
jgi:hypothetical protein